MTRTAAVAQIRRAAPDDTNDLAALLADAFMTADPIAGWLVPDVEERRGVFIAYFSNVINHALKAGHVEMTADGAAVSLWYPHTTPLPEQTDIDLPEAISGPHAERFWLLDITIADHHPFWANHRLGWLAVKPSERFNGRGTALLQHHHAALDALGLPAWLMAATSQARDWFQQHAYQLHTPAGLPFAVPGGPPLWKMWREPNRSAAGSTDAL